MPLVAGGLAWALHPGRLVGGHALRVFDGGQEAYPAMLAAIASAQREICLETYIWAPDATGRRFAAALAERARAGVAVHVVVDGAGSFNLDSDVWAPLVTAGAGVAVFHPVAPWRRRWGWSVRDHRKLLVVDGQVAFLGGLNLADDYVPKGPPWHGGGWRDVHLRVEGPAVGPLRELFAGTLRYLDPASPSLGKMLTATPGSRAARLTAGAATASAATESAATASAATERATAISTGTASGGAAAPGGLAEPLAVGRRNQRKQIQDSFLFAVHAARESVWIESAYFIPNRSWRRALAAAAARGVDVRLLVPRQGDVPGIRWASRYTWTTLLAAGVRIFEYLPAMLHAKTLLVDGAWAAIGSYNLDARSFRYNWELALAMVDPGVSASLRSLFESALREAEEIDAASWPRRPLLDRLRERFSYFFRLWL